MRRVFFVNRFYWPDEPATAQLLTDLAVALARAGEEVTVIASRTDPARQPRVERHAGVSIVRVRTSRWQSRALAGRIVSFCFFYCGAFWQLLRRLRHGDLAVALTDPPLVGVLVGLAAAVRGARCAHWVQDIYPEIATQLTGQRWLLALRPLRDAAWRRAQFCVVPGSDMARALIHAGLPVERIITSPNWAPVGLSPQPEASAAALRAAWGLTDKFVVGYSGNLGRAHDLLPLLDLAEIMREDDRFAFLFVGVGPQRTVLETSARSRGLDAVQFRPPQPRDRLAASLAVADVHCVTLRAGAEQWVFPSKLYGIAAIGRPVAFIGSGHSEIARLIRSHGLGEAFERSEMDRFAAWLRQLRNQPTLLKECGTAALAFSTGGFDRALASWRRALADLPPDKRTGTKANR